MAGPPFFYFENVVTSRSAWSTIQRHFQGVDPEFVDSKYFSCAKRERGYVHNLPIEGRELIIPEPPLTLKDAFPEANPYWPVWDTRKKLECIDKKRAPEKICREIREKIEQYRGVGMPLLEQQEIISSCKEYNLIWVGPGEVANLEPNEMEMVLGFDHDHTRGSFTMRERLEALENAFQVNTVAYHLSPLKRMFPNGIRVLSLFAGVGGAEVALHKIGIFLRHVVCVEIKEKCRNVVEIWWKKTNQRGNITFINDVQDLTYDAISQIFEDMGGFDLVIGSNPCADPSGEQREEDCRLFYEFPRILNILKHLTSKWR
jgi:site-specific DNA-cytosine methylase